MHAFGNGLVAPLADHAVVVVRDEEEAMAATREARAVRAGPLTGRARYTAVAVTGLVLAGLAPALMLVMSLVFGLDVGEDLGFLGIAIAVPWVVAFLVWRFGTWAKVLGILASLAAGVTLFWMAFGLMAPASFADFVSGVLLPLGVLLGLTGSIAALVSQLRGRVEPAAGPGERRVVTAALGLVLLAAVVSGVLNLTGRTTVDEQAAAGATAATMKDFAFVEGTYETAAGGSIVVRNDDPFLHDFTVPDLGIAVDVLPGSSQLVELDAQPGEYTIYCTLHSDPSAEQPSPDEMAATLVVR
jgi:plastocyanin